MVSAIAKNKTEIDLHQKKEIYSKYNVLEYWTIDPRKQNG
ncbi:MAG TPA: hypothetical protein ENJ95_20585 [Bacteroidetes bacterium]|nr:hypothetical protein [Bacteroidota bacterium]